MDILLHDTRQTFVFFSSAKIKYVWLQICVFIPILYVTKEALEWIICGRIMFLITLGQTWFMAIVSVKVFIVLLFKENIGK